MSQTGEIRFNDVSGLVEGWSLTGYVNFSNLWDSDRNTYITAELTPGANDHTIRIGINGVVKARVTSTELFTNTIHVDNIRISSNNIDNLSSTTDIELIPTGTGVVNVNDVDIIGDTITNHLNSSIELNSTGNGYVKFAGTYGVVLPYGPTDDRRLLPEVGESRYNSDLGYMEVFDGVDWIAATGVNPNVNLDQAEDIMNIWSLILG